MFAALKKVLSRFGDESHVGTSEPSLLTQIEDAPLDQDDHKVLHLLHVAQRDGDDAAAQVALRRLRAYYDVTDAPQKRFAVLLQLAELCPEDEALAQELSAARRAAGHPEPPPPEPPEPAPRAAPRRRAEVVRLPLGVALRLHEAMADTLPPGARIDDADTEVDTRPTQPSVPDDPTAQVDPKMLDLLRRLSR